MFPSVDLSKKKWAGTFNSAVKAHWENIFFFFHSENFLSSKSQGTNYLPS